MQTRIVSFRLPVKDYAILLSEAADKKMDLSDYVLALLFARKQEFKASTYKNEYKNLLSSLIEATNSNKNIPFIEKNYGKGSRIVACDENLIRFFNAELKKLS